MDKEDSQAFNKELKNIKENSLDYEDGLEKLDATNPVESVNSMIEKVRTNLGGYFQSVDIFVINLLIQRNNLKNGK
jgi:NAD(P)-dependent dehydrogenase (short-subunit alcohol dehydrogenase family)